MSDATTPSASPHASHDVTLVAALAARAPGTTEAELARGRELTNACNECAAVLADLLLLQTALPQTSTPRRPRDFRLTAEDATRLQRTGWRRMLGFFGSTRDNVSRPLAVGLTTIGLAGLLVASLPSMFMASSAGTAGAPVGQAVGEAAAPAPEAYATAQASAAAASDASEESVFVGGEPTQLEAQRDVAGDEVLTSGTDPTGLPTLFVVGGALLIAGLGLFALRWSARRLL